jgi:signal transduction histidine kinase
VKDFGRGISSDRLLTIFDMFHTGDGEGVGLGVGLAVVKGLTEVHGGGAREERGVSVVPIYPISEVKTRHLPS